MSLENNARADLKAFVKKIPFAVPLFRAGRIFLRSLLKPAFLLVPANKYLYWKPLLRSKTFRAAFFDAAPPNMILFPCAGKEKYLISSSDKIIGREIFIEGNFDFGKFEKALSLLDRNFKRELLIDIGANIGTICIPAIARQIFSRAIAFEPEPFNYSLLVSNIGLNGLDAKIKSYNVALGDVEKEFEFELSKTNYGDHRIRVSKTDGVYNEARRKIIRVSCKPLDSILDDVDPHRALIWMDVQGFEGAVLKGAQRILKNRPPVVVEFWPYGMKRSASYDMFKSSICRSGYQSFFDLGDIDANLPIPVSEENFDKMFHKLNRGGEHMFADLLIV